ncbi:hypothetical protein AOLI_G00200390, partial [Acnodon oligacanthus]
MLALLERKDEKEDGSWIIVPTFHIRHFNESDFMDGLDDRPSYVVEWRAGLKEKPRGGRPLYEAAVHKTAEKQSTLEKVMTDEKSSPGILTKRKGRPNPKSVDASDVDEEASVPEKVMSALLLKPKQKYIFKINF